MDLTPKWIASIIAPLTAVLGMAFGYGKLNQRLKSLDDAVYLPDGSWRFAPNLDMCAKLEAMSDKLDTMQKEHASDMQTISGFMGEVKQALKNRGN